VQVSLWSSSGGTVPATIREISAAADPVTRTFLVKADFGSTSTAPRLGQTATVAIAAPRLTGIARVPLSALREHQGASSVWIVDPVSMTVVARPVQMGGGDGNEAVVLAGLQPGERVVTAGVHVLSAGQKVRLYADPEAPLAAAPAPARIGRAAAAVLPPTGTASVASTSAPLR
jgi:RND family efflux transporter MFP subunit